MAKQPEDKIVSKWAGYKYYERNDLNETIASLETIGELWLTLGYLEEKGAPQEYLDAVEIAINDVSFWVVQSEVMQRILRLTSARTPEALLTLWKFIQKQEAAVMAES